MTPNFRFKYPIITYSLDRAYNNDSLGVVSIPRNALIPHTSEMMEVTHRQARVLAAIALCERYQDLVTLKHHDVTLQETVWWDREHAAVEFDSEYVEVEDEHGELVEKRVPYVRLTCQGHAYLRHLKAVIPFLCSDLYIYSYITERT